MGTWKDTVGSLTPNTSSVPSSDAWKTDLPKRATPVTPYRAPKSSLTVSKFAAEMDVAFLDIITGAASMLSGLVARHPEMFARTPVSRLLLGVAETADNKLFQGKAAKSWENLIEQVYGKPAYFAEEAVNKLKENPYLQPTAAYQNATLKEKLTTQFDETLFHLGANVAGSWAAYLVGGAAVGAGVIGLSTANDVKKYAREAGMPEDQSDVLALGTGALVGLLDKVGFEKVFRGAEKGIEQSFIKGLVNRIMRGGLSEGVTEVAQEDVQIAAEATVRDDLTLPEVVERNVMSTISGLLGGSAGSAFVGSVNDVLARVQESQNKPKDPPPDGGSSSGSTAQVAVLPLGVGTGGQAVDKPKTQMPARIFAVDTSKMKGSLMDAMRGKFQLGIDTKTADAIHIGDPTTPTVGSAYEVGGKLFIVRDVDVDGTIIGYVLPMDGSPNVSLEVVGQKSLEAITVDVGTIKKAIAGAKVSSSDRRSEQFVTNDIARATIRKYFTDEELTVEFTEKINTPEGGEAFGRYTPHMIEMVNNPHKTTADHEAVHAYLDLFYGEGEKEAVFESARKQGAEGGEVEVEEWVADRFARFVQSRTGVTGAIRDFFDRVLGFLRRTMRRSNPDKVQQLFDDIRSRRRPATPKAQSDIRAKYYQEPDKLTAKIFTFPELSDRVTVSRQFLSDFMKSGKANLKQAEYLLLQDVLNTQFKPKVETTRPDYGVSHRPTFEGMPPAYDLLVGDQIPRDVYEHPEWSIASGRNVRTDKSAKESWDALLKIRNNPEADVTIYRASPKNELNSGDWITFSKNYAESEVDDQRVEKVFAYKIKAKDAIFAGDDINEFGYYPVPQESPSDKIDVQAFKKAVEQELLPLDRKTTTDIEEYEVEDDNTITPRYKGTVLPDDLQGDVEAYAENIYESPVKTSAGGAHFAGATENYFAHTRIEDMADGTTRRVIEVQSDLFQKGRLDKEIPGEVLTPAQLIELKTRKPTDKVSQKELDDLIALETARTEAKTKKMLGVKKLADYSQTWWQRIIREEIRTAAMDGKKRLLFPTGETIVKIQGLGQGGDRWFQKTGTGFGAFEKVTPENLKVGMTISDDTVAYGLDDNQAQWIITDVLGDGKFKAVPKNIWDGNTNRTSPFFEGSKESFDISGKVDKENPIYRYYERDVVPYIQKLRRGNAELITDAQGVTWIATALTQEDRAPVLAFQRATDEPEPQFDALNEAGAIASPDAELAGEETIAAYEIERELGFIPEPGQMPAGLIADLEYRRHLALAKVQDSEMREEADKEQAIIMLEEGLIFPDSEMEFAYERFRKEAKRRKWMVETASDEATLKQKLAETRAYSEAGAVDSAFFPSIEGMTNDEMLDQYKSRFEVERDLLETMKKKTAVQIRTEAKRLAERVVRDATIKKAERVKTVIKKINARPKNEITLDEMKLLQDRFRAMAQGSKAGFVAGKRFTKDELMTKWRQSETDRLAVVDNLTEYLTQNLPLQQRGRFVKAIAKLKASENAKIALGIMDQIDRVQEGFEKRQAIDEFGENVTRFKKGAQNIALDYQARIIDILSSYQQKQPTAATLRRLNALASFMEQNPDAFIPSDVTARLKRLSRTSLPDLTSKEIEEINTTVSELARLGKLKQELKNVYDEREWQKNVDALVAGTINRDRKPDGSFERTYNAVLGASDEITAPARVFDKMDGEKSYAGENVAQYKRIRSGSQQAEIVSNDLAAQFLEGMKEAGVDSLTKEQQTVLVLHSALDQGNQSSVTFTMEKLGMTTLRPLTEQEQKVLDLARATVAVQTDDFAATFEEKHNKRFVRVEENYLPFRYADQSPQSAEDYVIDERMLKRSVEPGSVIERVPEVRRELRLDFVNIVLQAIESQSRYIYIEPAMMDVSALVKSKEYREAAGTHNSHYWNEYIDAVARDGASANALKMRWVDPFLKGARFNVSAAILGGRLTTIVLQPFTLFHAYGMMTMRYGAGTAGTLMTEIGRTFFDPKIFSKDAKYKNTVLQSPSLTLRQGGDATVRELLGNIDTATSENPLIKARNKTIELALKGMKALDLWTAASTDQAIYRILRARGMTDIDARAEADFVTDLIASSSQIADRPLIFSRGEGVRMFAMFMSFALNEWGIVSHDIVKSGLLKGDYQAKYRATFALSLVFASKMLEQVMRDFLRDLLRKEEDKKKLPSVTAMSVLSIVSIFPWFGSMVSGMLKGYDTQLADSPLIRTVEDFGTGIKSAVTGKQEATRIRGWLRVVKSVSTLSGVPGLPLLLDWMKNNLVD